MAAKLCERTLLGELEKRRHHLAAALIPVLLSVVAIAPSAQAAVGRTAGSFDVTSTGAASYTIPIFTPPGARGLEPKLALNYNSEASGGAMGPGWNLSGFSAITRCKKTYADNGGSPAAVTATAADDFCLNGNRLRVTSGTYGTAGSMYQTAVADFSRITANGTAGAGPSHFLVEGKDGLYYEYGNSADSRVYATSSSTPYAWLLNKIRDRIGNNLVITYTTATGSALPSTIKYTQTPLTNGTTYPYVIDFTYLTSTDTQVGYIAGSSVQKTKVLSNINVQSSGTSVRQYKFIYEASPSTQRSRLKSVQECAGSAGTDCLSATTFTYQNGAIGIANPTTTGISPSFTKPRGADVNGDGISDLLYGVTSGSNITWYVKFGSSSGTFGSATSTGFTTTSSAPVLVGDIYGKSMDCLMSTQGTTWTVVSWNGSSFSAVSTGLAIDAGSSNVLADTDGDGLVDLVTMRTNKRIYIRLNGSGSGTPAFGAATLAHDLSSVNLLGFKLYSDFEGSSPGVRVLDFNGDGRQDIIIWKWVQVGQADVERYGLLLGNGSTFSATSTEYPNGNVIKGFGHFNNDACTDLLFATEVRFSACSGVTSNWVSFGTGTPLGSVDGIMTDAQMYL